MTMQELLGASGYFYDQQVVWCWFQKAEMQDDIWLESLAYDCWPVTVK